MLIESQRWKMGACRALWTYLESTIETALVRLELLMAIARPRDSRLLDRPDLFDA